MTRNLKGGQTDQVKALEKCRDERMEGEEFGEFQGEEGGGEAEGSRVEGMRL